MQLVRKSQASVMRSQDLWAKEPEGKVSFRTGSSFNYLKTAPRTTMFSTSDDNSPIEPRSL